LRISRPMAGNKSVDAKGAKKGKKGRKGKPESVPSSSMFH
jgi:hypothetical protein